MKKILTFISIVFFMTANIFAQNDDFIGRYKEITDTNVIDKLKSEISESFKKIESIECNYLMKKEIPMLYKFPDTKGTMRYKKSEPSELYWSSDSPQKSNFTLKNDSIEFVKTNEFKKMAVDEHPIFREVSQIIKSGEKNGSFIDESMFSVRFDKCEGDLYITLHPKKSKMKKIIDHFYIKMDYATKVVKQINVYDASKSETSIILSNVKTTNVKQN